VAGGGGGRLVAKWVIGLTLMYSVTEMVAAYKENFYYKSWAET